MLWPDLNGLRIPRVCWEKSLLISKDRSYLVFLLVYYMILLSLEHGIQRTLHSGIAVLKNYKNVWKNLTDDFGFPTAAVCMLGSPSDSLIRT